MSELIRNITEITRCGTQYRTEMLAPLGLKACHASYLMEICTDPGISQDQLAQRICINKSNVARQAAILEEGGFITRCSCCEDKRVMRLYPTEQTLQMLPQIQAVTGTWESLLTYDLTQEEMETFSSLLDRMKAKATAWMEAH